MNRHGLVGLLFVALPVVGCDIAADANPKASTDPTDYVGEYVFRPNGDIPQGFAGFLVLKKDQTAVEIRFFENTGQVQTTEKKWHLIHTTEEDVVIGDFSHPVEGSRSAIRLGINGDLGQYYEKVR